VFPVTEGEDLLAETAVLHKEPAKRGAMLDIALVGHLRVSGSMSLEAPSALRPGKTVVGRENADIVAEDKTLSARHFEIDNRDGEFFIRDLGSTNGTSVDGQPLAGTARLEDGARIEAGETTFVFRTLETIPWAESD
jgi:pSer/pThr/pTyr-binding forkhead associated (FHA) protein